MEKFDKAYLGFWSCFWTKHLKPINRALGIFGVVLLVFLSWSFWCDTIRGILLWVLSSKQGDIKKISNKNIYLQIRYVCFTFNLVVAIIEWNLYPHRLHENIWFVVMLKNHQWYQSLGCFLVEYDVIVNCLKEKRVKSSFCS